VSYVERLSEGGRNQRLTLLILAWFRAPASTQSGAASHRLHPPPSLRELAPSRYTSAFWQGSAQRAILFEAAAPEGLVLVATPMGS